MTTDVIPVMPLSMWNPVHLGTDELGNRVEVALAERNKLIGGEPGAGKSVAMQLIVAHAALSADCHLILVDGKRVELGLWRDCAERFIGPSIDDAIDTLHWLQGQIDELDRPGDLGGSDPWEDAESWQHSGNTLRSCASARSRWCSRSGSGRGRGGGRLPA
jgi:FtsK/SpoIIIE family